MSKIYKCRSKTKGGFPGTKQAVCVQELEEIGFPFPNSWGKQTVKGEKQDTGEAASPSKNGEWQLALPDVEEERGWETASGERGSRAGSGHRAHQGWRGRG